MSTDGDRVARTDVAALLLSGGQSRRMGRDKTQLLVGDRTLAQRTGELLQRVVTTALEVGPGTSRLPWVSDAPGEGPLKAIATGWLTLRGGPTITSALVIASDLPFVSEPLLRFLVDYDAPGSIVPVVQGVAQPLCARWSVRDLAASVQMVEEGERSLRGLLARPGVVVLDDSHWGRVATIENFLDIDTPEEAQRWGMTF